MPGQAGQEVVFPLDALNDPDLGVKPQDSTGSQKVPRSCPIALSQGAGEGGRCPESPLTKPAGQPTSWPLAQLHLVACTEAT